MTLDSKLSKAVYLGNGFTTVFPFAFKVWNINHIAVTVTDAAGVSTDVTSNSTVTLTSSGGSVSYPNTGSPLPTGAKLAIVRNMPFTQSINLTTASRFDPQVLEDGLDQATAERQQILEQMARAVILPATSSESPEDVVASIYASRDAAAVSASAASNKADAAEVSAQAAANSASTAAQTVTTAAAEAVSAATAQANAAHDSAQAAATAAAEAAASTPATTTSRGIGRVATSADLVDGATINNGPAFLAAGSEAERLLLRVTEKYDVGEFYYFRHPTMKPSFAAAQGGLISGAYQGKNITEYPIWAYLQTAEGQLLLKSEADWQAMTTATWATLANGSKVGWNGIGGAPYYVQNLSSGTLRMPDLRGMYAEAAGFDPLGVGGVHGDAIRQISGNITGQLFWAYWNSGGDTSSAMYISNGSLANVSTGGSSGYRVDLTFSASRSVPTATKNQPRAWGALACCYLGQPA